MRARENPYRVERLESLEYRLEGVTWTTVCKRLRGLGQQGCVLGPHGSGKTALLLSLAAFLRRRGMPVDYYVIRTDGPSTPLGSILSSLVSDRVAIIDGADLLDRRDWRRLRKTPRASLIVSSHQRRMLPTLYRCQPTPALLQDLMTELHPADGCGQPTAEQLYLRHGGNLREALLELYDFHASCNGPEQHYCGHSTDHPIARNGAAELRGSVRAPVARERQRP